MNTAGIKVRDILPYSIRRRKGLSIIEVAMASVLLIIAMVPILQNLTKAHAFSAAIERKTYSLALAQGKFDEIRARSIYHYSDSFSANDVVLSGSYLCDITDDQDAALRTITISVGLDRNGDSALGSGEAEVSITSYVARRW